MIARVETTTTTTTTTTTLPQFENRQNVQLTCHTRDVDAPKTKEDDKDRDRDIQGTKRRQMLGHGRSRRCERKERRRRDSVTTCYVIHSADIDGNELSLRGAKNGESLRDRRKQGVQLPDRTTIHYVQPQSESEYESLQQQQLGQVIMTASELALMARRQTDRRQAEGGSGCWQHKLKLKLKLRQQHCNAATELHLDNQTASEALSLCLLYDECWQLQQLLLVAASTAATAATATTAVAVAAASSSYSSALIIIRQGPGSSGQGPAVPDVPPTDEVIHSGISRRQHELKPQSTFLGAPANYQIYH
ncbi:hypothetical protein ACLKA7_015438 [Drosophila subpalustris]